MQKLALVYDFDIIKNNPTLEKIYIFSNYINFNEKCWNGKLFKKISTDNQSSNIKYIFIKMIILKKIPLKINYHSADCIEKGKSQ